jgi:phosphate transport system substrate-binding protein
MRSALLAVSTGVAVRLLPVDRVEPEKPTVKDGRYKLRRPVLLLMPKQEPNLVADAFAAFALSPAGQAILDREGYVPLDSKPSP